MLYATEHPERVERLALVSPAPATRAARAVFEERIPGPRPFPALQAARSELRISGLRERDLQAYQRRLFEFAVAGYFHDPERVSDLTPVRLTGRTQKEVWASLGDYDLRPALRALRVPALVVHGDDDPIPADSAESLATLLAAPFHLLAGCGHVPYVEAFEEFRRLLDAFLPA